MLRSVKRFEESVKLLQGLYVASARLDDMFALLDPEQHAFFSRVSEDLKQKFASYELLAQWDPTFFHGRSLIFNRETAEHVDRLDTKLGWTPLINVGTHTEGKLRVVDLDIDYLPGTLVFIRGGILPHSVTFSGGQRIAIAHFMHKDVINTADNRPLPISKLKDLQNRFPAKRSKGAADGAEQ